MTRGESQTFEIDIQTKNYKKYKREREREMVAPNSFWKLPGDFKTHKRPVGGKKRRRRETRHQYGNEIRDRKNKRERERETQDNEDKRQGRERRSCLFLTCPLLFFVSVFI